MHLSVLILSLSVCCWPMNRNGLCNKMMQISFSFCHSIVLLRNYSFSRFVFFHVLRGRNKSCIQHSFFSYCCGPFLVGLNPMAYTSLQRNPFNVGQASIEPKIDIWISRCPLLPIVFIYAKNLIEMCMCQKRKRKRKKRSCINSDRCGLRWPFFILLL